LAAGCGLTPQFSINSTVTLPTVSEKVNFSAMAPDDELLLDEELLDDEELLLEDEELELLDDELELDDELLELELLLDELDELDDVVPPQAANAPISVDNTTTRESDDAEKRLNSTIMCTR
jgi:hypothetical protein